MKAAILGMGNMGKIHNQVYDSAGFDVRWFEPRPGYPDETSTIEWADIVSICSPDNFHAEQIIKAFEMGKHVFCEKPLCHTRPELEAIKAAYQPKRDRCALGMNFPLRWHEPFVEAKARVQSGELGEIYLIEADYEYGRLSKMTNGWRGQMEGYSVVMGGGLHMIDLLGWFGVKIRDSGGHSYRPGWNCWTTVSVTGLENGGVFKLTCDFAGSKNHARRLRICGTADSLYIDDRDPTDKGVALAEFLQVLRGNGPHVSMAKNIFRVHEIGLSL